MKEYAFPVAMFSIMILICVIGLIFAANKSFMLILAITVIGMAFNTGMVLYWDAKDRRNNQKN